MKQVILVRKDLNMSPGKAAAQCCHASLTSFLRAKANHAKEASEWMTDGQTKIILMVDDEKQLLEIYKQVVADKDLKGRNALIIDAGHTELKGQNTTTLGIGPCKPEHVDKYTRQLKLYK